TVGGITGDKSQESQGKNDYWIVKIDSSGSKQWDARYGGSYDDIFNSLQQTSDGGYILAGYSASEASGDKTQNSRGGWDYWIVRTDANGIKLWDARFGGSDGDNLKKVIETTDGGFLLAG